MWSRQNASFEFGRATGLSSLGLNVPVGKPTVSETAKGCLPLGKGSGSSCWSRPKQSHPWKVPFCTVTQHSHAAQSGSRAPHSGKHHIQAGHGSAVGQRSRAVWQRSRTLTCIFLMSASVVISWACLLPLIFRLASTSGIAASMGS